MKKLLCISELCLVLLCAGCSNSKQPAPTTVTTEATEIATEAPTTVPTAVATTEALTEPTTEATEEATEAPIVAANTFEPYVIQLSIYTDIYKTPSFSSYNGDYVEESNIYTIVAEKWDQDGNLWGKLKSGRGWVLLSAYSTPVQSELPYTVNLSADTAIYKGPSLDTDYVRSVAKNGVYTIVEESWDSVGNLWGKLKSGLGWVFLRVSSTYTGPICSRCGDTNSYSFSEDWKRGDLCIGCIRDEMHFGDDGGLFCSKCGKDYSYMGLDADGTCEFCN